MYRAIKRYSRLSLLTWLLVFSISCILAFAYACVVRPSHAEANAIQALKDLGIDVAFNYEHEFDGIGFDGMSGQADPPGPDWIKAVFGKMALAKISAVKLTGRLKTLDDCRDHLEQLTHLRCLSIDSSVLENIDALNQLQKLEKITLRCESKSLKDIRVLSNMNLSSVSLWRCSGLASLDSLRKIVTLEELKIHHCDGIKELNLHRWETKKLKEVSIDNCNRLVTVSGFPQGSEPCELGLCDCLAVKEIVIGLESNLHLINIDNCTKLDSLGILPESLATLYLSDCDSLRNIGSTESSKLTCIDIGSCSNLVSLDALLKNAEVIRLSECNGIQSLNLTQPIPKLQVIRVGSCDGIASIDGLPESVEELDLSECQSLVRVTAETSLPNLRVCDLLECPSLLESPEVVLPP